MLTKKFLLLGLFTANAFVLPIVATTVNVADTIDQAPSVPLKMCSLCSEIKEVNAFTQLACGHSISCTNCLVAYIKSMISSHQLQQVKCPYCSRQISYQEVIDLLGTDTNDYIDLQTFNWAKYQEHLKHCPTPDCKFYFINESTCAHAITCPQCVKNYCNQCLISHDQNISCAQAQANNQTSEVRANNQWKESHSKQCPRCKTHIEKNEGCNHMTCNNCHYEFCWICLEQYPCPRRSYCPHPVPQPRNYYNDRTQISDRDLFLIAAGAGLIIGGSLGLIVDALKDLRAIPHLQLPFFR